MLKIKLLNLVTFALPYYFLRGLTVMLCSRRHREIWGRLPFKNLESPLLLTDGNLLYCPWREVWWIWMMVKEIYHFQIYEKFYRVERNSTVVDVGAHIGIYACKMEKKVGPKGRVIAVEPDDENHRLLIRNIAINGSKKVIPIKLALSDFEGKAKFYLKDHSTDHSLHEKIDRFDGNVVGSKEVVVTTLSKILHKLQIENIELLKIDAEGAEPEILRGSEELLAQRRICNLAIAAYHNLDEVLTIREYLEKFGYEINVVEVNDRKYLYATYRT